MEQLSHNHSENSNELLSAYIDDAVDVVERKRAETYIASCAACAQEVRELRMFRDLMRDLPAVQPRRSFTLDPATVTPPRRLLFPTLRWASLVATVLFVLVLSVDALGVGGNGASAPEFTTMSAPSTAQKEDSANQAQGRSSSTTGGAPETIMVPQASPAASPLGEGQGAGGVPGPPLAAEIGPTAVDSAAVSAPPSEASIPAAPRVGDMYPAPELAQDAPPFTTTGVPAAGGSAEQLPQPAFRAQDPAGADTLNYDQNTPAQGSWWSSWTLQLAEVVLGIIALLLGIGAVWTWRRQM